MSIQSTAQPNPDSEEASGVAPKQQPEQKSEQKRMSGWAALLILFAAIAAIVLAGVFVVRMTTTHMSAPAADLNLSTTRMSDGQLYRLSYVSDPAAIPVNQLHTWRLHVETPDGVPVENATITVNGDMPQHGHGMPTQPQVTQELGNGDYLVEGMKFQMGGWWVVDFTVQAEGGTDTAQFDLLLSQ